MLGGGGVAGIAWMTGLLLGLAETGTDLRSAGMLIGTSAGATVAAQIASPIALDVLFRKQVDPDQQVAELTPEPHILELIGNMFPVLLKLADPPERTRRIGTLATQATTVEQSERRKVIAARLPSHEWPDRGLRIVAVDAATGESRIFDRFSGVNLVDAVSASCAVPGIWPPVMIKGARYMDGGLRSSDNADLASGAEIVVVISPLGIGGLSLPGSLDLSFQVAALERNGARVRLVEPDAGARQAIGSNPLSPVTRALAAHAGRTQGRELTAAMADFL
ncbi:MAG: patatin-like phospholipase family protein [Janthinobacterium lividum]